MRVSFAAAASLIVISVVAATWPFALTLSNGVSDLGDPLLNSWALAWVAHTLPQAPASVFDANIFFPETIMIVGHIASSTTDPRSPPWTASTASRTR